MPAIPTELVLTCISGGGTIFGGLLVFYLNPSSNSAFGDLEAACAGIMIVISFQLVLEGLEVLDLFSFTFSFLIGFMSLYLLNYLLKTFLPSSSSPHSSHHLSLENGLEKKEDDLTLDRGALLLQDSNHRKEYSRLGLICFISMFFHNLPEGISVALSARSDLSLGIELAVAIFFHNVLEGMVVALPIWFESKSQYQVILWTTLNGAAEPLGVILCWLFAYIMPISIDLFIPKVLTAVSGLMIALSIVELLPHSISLIGSSSMYRTGQFFASGFAFGAVVMYVTRQWINSASS